ncbi:MAG: O-antigen ligase family protein [Eubacteriales bacterium]|nr:O-antigen ligase family protein [Eubacteriales bacterium]
MRRKKKTERIAELLPLILLAAVLPFVVHLKIVETGLADYPWFPDLTSQGDFFAWWRTRMLMILAGWMLVNLGIRIVVRKKYPKGWKSWIWLGIYLVLAFVSAAVSDNRSFAVNGMIENYEGIWTLVSYGIAAFYAGQVLENGEDVRTVFWALAFGAAIQGILGIGQILGYDFWNSSAGQALLTAGTGLEGQTLSYQFAESKVNPVYMSFYNPNYAVVYILLMLPILFCLAADAKEKWKKGICAGIGALLLICLVGTGSKAAIVTIPVMLIAGVLLCVKGKKSWMIAGASGVLLLTAGAGYLWKNPVSRLTYSLQDIQVEEDAIELTLPDGKIRVNAEAQGKDAALIIAREEDGTKIALIAQEEENCYRLDRDGTKNLVWEAYQQQGLIYLILHYKEEPFYFVKDAAHGFTYVTIYGKADTIETADACGMEGYERLFGERMYIWSRCVGLLKNNLLLGSGPDTFALVFPQNDYLAKVNTNRKVYEEILTKPHSLYLQMGVQTGVLSLAVTLVFWLAYLWNSWRIYRNRKMDAFEAKAGCAAAIAVLGYLILGLANDSMSVTAPFFWCLLGVGMALNRMNQMAEKN